MQVTGDIRNEIIAVLKKSPTISIGLSEPLNKILVILCLFKV